MQRKIIMLILLVTVILFQVTKVKCDDEDVGSGTVDSEGYTVCDYYFPKQLSIRYNATDASIVNSEFLNNIGEEKNFIIFKMNHTSYDVSAIKRIPENLYEVYKGKCPGYLYVCEFTKSKLTFTSPTGAGMIVQLLKSGVTGDASYEWMSGYLKIYTSQEYDSNLEGIKDKDSSFVDIDSGAEIVENKVYNFNKAIGISDTKFGDAVNHVVSWFAGHINYNLDKGGAGWITGYPVVVNSTICAPSGERDYNINCVGLESRLKEYSDLIDDYKACGDDYGCKAIKITKLNKSEDTIKGVCKYYFDFYNYHENNPNDGQGECLNSCLHLKSKLNELRQGTDLYEDYSNLTDTCAMSDDIISMVYNVLKWAKYIAPVLVIILSILDFIKALASQSDDEMKKAQGRFIKRLIVAALLFLIPLIINFALKTFGFYHSGCDITDLF